MITDGIAAYIGANVEELRYDKGSDSNVFVDWLPSAPADAVGIYTTPGTEADSKLPYDAPGFEIIVRTSEGSAWAVEKQRQIYSALHGLRNTTLPDGTYVVFVIGEQSSPFRLGADDNGRPRWSLDYRSEILETTTHRT